MRKYLEEAFTLIELIIVMIIIGILAALITPRFLDLETEANAAALRGAVGSVKSAWAISMAQRAGEELSPTQPTVTDLAKNVTGGTAVNSGIQMEIKGQAYIVNTYTGECEDTGSECIGSGTGSCPETSDLNQTVNCINGTTKVAETSST